MNHTVYFKYAALPILGLFVLVFMSQARIARAATTPAIVVTPADFQATVVGTSTLLMTFDHIKNEGTLISSFNVAITAGTAPLLINKNYAFNSYVTTADGVSMSGTEHYNQPAGTNDNGNGYYEIPAGRTVLFSVTTAFDPDTMFSGAYHGVLQYVSAGLNYGDGLEIPAPNTTDTVAVVGEQAPYIATMAPNPAKPGDTIILTGLRFAENGNMVTIRNSSTGYKTTLSADSSKQGTSVQFTAPVASGDYQISVTNPDTGASNNVYLTVLGLGVPANSPQTIVMPGTASPSGVAHPSMFVSPTATPSPTLSGNPSVTSTPSPSPTQTVFGGGGSSDNSGGGVVAPPPPPPPPPSSAPSAAPADSGASQAYDPSVSANQPASVLDSVGRFLDGVFGW
jgi:hypothetical protein